LEEWDPEEGEQIEVPFAESARERPDDDSLTRYHETDADIQDDDEGVKEGTSGGTIQSTTLDDF